MSWILANLELIHSFCTYSQHVLYCATSYKNPSECLTATIARQENCSWWQQDQGWRDSADFEKRYPGSAHFSLPQWQSFRVQRWCRCTMIRQNDRLNQTFQRNLDLQFSLCARYLASLWQKEQVFCIWVEKMQPENRNKPQDLMPLSLGQQWILQYQVLSGITFLEEMSLPLLNKRLQVGITLINHSQDQ